MQKIKLEIKTNNNTYIYQGNAIIKNNQITFKDQEKIKIELTNPIKIKTNTKDLTFIQNKLTKCTYNINNQYIQIDIYTNKIEKTKNKLKINYETRVQNQKIDTFELILIINY